jgi:hypothetical protein
LFWQPFGAAAEKLASCIRKEPFRQGRKVLWKALEKAIISCEYNAASAGPGQSQARPGPQAFRLGKKSPEQGIQNTETSAPGPLPPARPQAIGPGRFVFSPVAPERARSLARTDIHLQNLEYFSSLA